MMREPAIGSYRDAAGARHELVVREAADAGWHVLDLNLDGETAHVVDALQGGEDGRPQAEAIARDYLGTVGEDAGAGRTPADPISEQGGSDDRIHRRPRPGPHKREARGAALRLRLADGRVFSGALAPERHCALQLGVLHEQTDGLVELAAGARRDGRLQITTRRRADHFLPGGHAGGADWLRALLALAARHADRGEEVFVAPAARVAPRGDKHAVSETRFLWVDVDEPGQLPALWAVLGERPCHLLVETSSERVHAYWKLAEPLPATRVIEATGELVEPIERAHLRLIHHLGRDAAGKPNVADPACAERSRVLRLAGTVNKKTGAYARILEADLALPAYPIRQLVGDLPDPVPAATPRVQASGTSSDPYKRISPREYFERLAGVVVPRDGLVCCPAAGHEDRNPSCSVGTDPGQGWRCHAGGCGARGAIYDLASVLLGGPWGPDLRGEAFRRARAYVVDVFGEPPDQRQPVKG